MKTAIVGATGLVGSVMCRVLESRLGNSVTELIPVASEKSVGQKITFKNKEYRVVSLAEGIAARPDVALFSAGGSVSLEYAPKFKAAGTTVIDNSSAWRMHPDIKLIVPEINGHLLTANDKIIANPNCSTIQMVVALNPLHKKYGIKRLVISTYQAVTGTGAKAVRQLQDERKGIEGEKIYPYTIDLNCIPQCDVFVENNYTKEEMKMVHETRKILGDNSLRITATCARVPVTGGHSESVNIEFEKDFAIEDIRKILSEAEGVIVTDDIANKQYPMPKFSEGKDEVFVGRIRRDESQPNSLNLWIVADNLRKGAATNAVQIAEYLLRNHLLSSKEKAAAI